MRCSHRYSDGRSAFVSTPRASTQSKMLPDEMVPQRCALCESRYPCAHACEHVDCIIETERELPDWVTEVVDAPQ